MLYKFTNDFNFRNSVFSIILVFAFDSQ